MVIIIIVTIIVTIIDCKQSLVSVAVIVHVHVLSKCLVLLEMINHCIGTGF